MVKAVLTKQEIVDEIELRLHLMVKFYNDCNEGCFRVSQKEFEFLVSLAYQHSILNDAEYARYKPLQYVLFYNFKNPYEV